LDDARLGRQTSLCSPPFYTHRYGYKLLTRLYLLGDGQGKASHLSVFLVVARGHYDALLSWPFRHKCTFTLVDQSMDSSKRIHISDSFRPDPSVNASSFRRPTSEMNVAAGLPLFCPLNTALYDSDRYLKDNTIFLKVEVE
jgi:TNF receptor-associated factor 2